MAEMVLLRIVDKLIDSLNTDRPPEVPVVTNRRVFPENPTRGAKMAVFLGDENVEPARASANVDPITRRRSAIAIQCVDATDDVGAIDTLTEPMLTWAAQVLGQPRVLTGLGHYMRETGTTRRVVYQDLFYVMTTVVYEVSYQTRRSDLTLTS